MSAVAYDIAISASFMESLHDLDKSARRAVLDALEKVQAGHPSVEVHKLHGVPFVSFGVNQNAMRVICQREAGTLMLCHVGAHDPAYDWAKRHRVAQVGRHVRIVRTVEAEAAANEAPTSPTALAKGPLADVKDEIFARLDVSAASAAVLRSVPDEGALLDLLSHFPPHRGDALMNLAIDLDAAPSIAESYAQAAAAGLGGPTLGEAVRDEANAGQFWIPSPEDEAYRAALSGDLSAWRVFLHPSQRRVVHVDARGALKVGGGPGTGKTVVALHRARHLAERLLAEDPRPVLLTCFSNPLTRQLEARVDELCAGAPEVRSRIVVLSTTRVAQELLKTAGRPNRLVSDLGDAWERALALDGAGRGRAFYESERAHVLARSDAWTEAAYLKAPRAGRTKRLDRAARKEVWAVLHAFETALAAAGGGDDLALAREATALLASGALASPYSAVVCDESQDLGAAELRLLAALARDRDRDRDSTRPAPTRPAPIRPNALTLCGDGYQRLYRAPISLLACGIETRGRSRTLRLNYRTTESIRRAAVALVAGQPLDAIDEGDPSALEGYRSLRRGASPEHHTFPSLDAEAAWIAGLAAEPEGALLVLARTNAYLEQLRALLAARGISPRMLGAQDLPQGGDTIVLGTLHRAKGLESPRVVLAGRHLVPAKYPGGGDPADRALWDRMEVALLYVGMTRARDWCAVSSVEMP